MLPLIRPSAALWAALALAACAPVPPQPGASVEDEPGGDSGGADTPGTDTASTDTAGTDTAGTEDSADSGFACERPEVWYQDVDGDGWGYEASTVIACDQPEGYARRSGDCMLYNVAVYPGATEHCDGLDNNCDGVVPTGETDGACAGDCQLDKPPELTAVVETCDGLDNDGDGAVDEDCLSCTTNVPADYATIQEAIDAASAGAVICVAPGTYEESLDFGGADIAVIGSQGPSVTTIEGDRMHPVVRFVTAEPPTTLLAGFTVTRGYDEAGGGLQIMGASPTIRDVVVTWNSAADWDLGGGGIFVDDGAPSFQTVVISHNSAILTYCVDDYSNGGGVFLSHDQSILDNVWIVNNVAGEEGGGVLTYDSEAVLTHVRIQENESENDVGGGLIVRGGAPRLDNVIVAGNLAATHQNPGGGGIHIRNGTVRLTNVVVACNDMSAPYSITSGAGIGVEGGSVELIDSVVSWNTTTRGAGVLLDGGTLTLTRSDVWANAPTDFSGMTDPTGKDGNITVDPGFEPSSVHLSAASPLIDAGDPVNLDPDGSPADLGAFGGPAAATWDLDGDRSASWWRPGPYDPVTSPGLDCDDGDPTVNARAGC